jgi:hypothetical protein
VGLDLKIEPCSHCFLIEFVPPEDRNKEDACHYIPLNRRGDTVASLNRAGKADELRAALRTWLQKSIFRLAEEAESPWSEEELQTPQVI